MSIKTLNKAENLQGVTLLILRTSHNCIYAGWIVKTHDRDLQN